LPAAHAPLRRIRHRLGLIRSHVSDTRRSIQSLHQNGLILCIGERPLRFHHRLFGRVPSSTSTLIFATSFSARCNEALENPAFAVLPGTSVAAAVCVHATTALKTKKVLRQTAVLSSYTSVASVVR
jgi:hypothetical protein